jgi:hypothetical protein
LAHDHVDSAPSLTQSRPYKPPARKRRFTIGKVLNHVDRGPRATRVCDVYDGGAERQTALEAWERRLVRILTEQAGDRAVPIRKRA